MFNADMQYRRLGNAGIRLSAIGLGGWTTYGASVKAEDTVRGIIRAAFEAGVNFFDISDIYEKGEAERAMGKVFAELPRHELVISTKCFWPMTEDVNDQGLSRKHIMESIDKSLKRIGTEYVDIYFCHRPDPNTTIEETARAMDDLIHRGKALYWGTSEWSAAQIREAREICERRNLYAPVVEQPQLHLAARKKYQQEIQPELGKHSMGAVTWSPLASGLLSGKYDGGALPEGARLWRSENLRKSYLTDKNRSRAEKMKAIADEAGVPRAHLAIAWCMAQPGVTSVITGATKLEQLKQNLGALKVAITPEINRKLEELFPAE